MKTLKKTAIALVLVGMVQSADAQLLKKIGERAEKAAERTILNKTDQKVSQKVGEGIDGAVDGKPGKKKKNKAKEKQDRASSASVAYLDAYAFKYLYKMKISGDAMKTDAMMMNYYLAPSASYSGMEMNQQGVEMFTVIDPENEAIHSFINMGDNKMANTIALPASDDEDATAAKSLLDYEITSLPEKTIAGHSCKGRQLEDDENIIVFYYTKVDGVHLNLFQGRKKQQVLPQHMKGLFDAESLVMYMEVTDKAKDQQTTIECIELTPTKYTFSTADYRSGLF